VYACATTVAAQTSRDPGQPPQTMMLTMSLFGGNSDQGTTASAGDSAISGPYADADANLRYQRRVGRVTFGLNGRSVLREAQSTLTPMGQEGGFDFAFVGPRNQFRALQTVSYSPYYQFGVMAEIAPTPLTEAAASHGDFANTDLTAVTTTTDVAWSRSFSQRTALSALYNLRRTTFDASALNMTTESVGAKLTRRMTRDLSLRTGYTYRFADTAFTALQPSGIHDIDVGVDYSRPVTFARRTTFSFSSGSSMTPLDEGLAFRLTGDAVLTKLFGRTWNARVGVNRSVQLLEGFTEPVLTNALNLAVGGSLQRRVSFATSASLSTGEVGLAEAHRASGNGTASWNTGAGLSISVGRRGAFDAQYFLAGDRFDGGVVVPPGVSNGKRQRQGVRVGFTWRPVLIGHQAGS
jgi:hypothetical protein